MDAGAPEPRPQSTEPRYRPSRLLAFGLRAAALVAIFCLEGRGASAEEDIEEKLAAIRARGEPVTAEELAPPPVPEKENAAPLLQGAFDALFPYQEWERAGIEGWEDLLKYEGETDLALAKRVLDLNAEAVAKARLALARPKCRFDLEYARGYDIELPHLAPLRALARLFALEALVRSAEGLGEEAAESCLAALALGRTVKTEPILISQLVRILMMEIGIRSVEDSLGRAALPDDALRRIRKSLSGIDPGSFSRTGLRGERVLLIQTYDEVILNKKSLGDIMDDDSPLQGIARRALRSSFREDEAYALEALAVTLEAIELPPHESVPAVNAIFADIEAEMREHKLKHILSGLLLPALGAAHTRAVRMWALRDAAVLGLSCELFRSANGRYPATLGELAPEFLDAIPPDPFTGKPFRYEVRDGGSSFIVYSVGDNLKDDGGVEDRPDKDDISWQGRATPTEGTRGE